MIKKLIFSKQFLVGIFLAGIFIFVFSLSTNSSAQEPPVPAAIADAEAGLLLFQERCAVCHGISGGGDGEMAPQSIKPPTVFNDPAFRLTAVPADMHSMIFNGSLQDGMPPFGAASQSPLSDQDIWNLIAAIYSFSTPVESMTLGSEVFAGAVDAGDSDGLTDLTLWAERTNEEMAVFIQQGVIADDAVLTDAEVTSLVDYARGTFSYSYIDPFAPLEPIETAVIRGEVFNGSDNNSSVGSGDAVLRAFTSSFAEALIMTTTVETDGSFTFTLSDVQPDWIYLATAEYKGYRFNSQPGLLETAEEIPELVLPITVFEETSDEEAIEVDQIHIILSFMEERLEVAQLYRFNNSGSSIFVGKTGDPSQGTAEFHLPPDAENVLFERGLGSLEDFFPAMDDMVQIENGWADTFPLRPGEGTLDMLVSYALPYDDGLELSHILPYGVGSVTLIMPDAGVSLEGDDWTFLGSDAFGSSNFMSYEHTTIAAGDSLSLVFAGRPTLIADAQGAIQPVTNQTNDLIVGGASLLIAVGAAIFMVQQWRRQEETAVPATPDELLEAIAELDDEFEAGEIDSQEYEQERELLKAELLALWK